MNPKERLTYKNRIRYTNGEPLLCECCGKRIGYIKDGKIYIFCRSCKSEINISAKSQ